MHKAKNKIKRCITVDLLKHPKFSHRLIPCFHVPYWLSHIRVYLFYFCLLLYIYCPSLDRSIINKQITKLWLRQNGDMETGYQLLDLDQDIKCFHACIAKLNNLIILHCNCSLCQSIY